MTRLVGPTLPSRRMVCLVHASSIVVALFSHAKVAWHSPDNGPRSAARSGAIRCPAYSVLHAPNGTGIWDNGFPQDPARRAVVFLRGAPRPLWHSARLAGHRHPRRDGSQARGLRYATAITRFWSGGGSVRDCEFNS